MLACLICLPFINDEFYQAIIYLHTVWGRIKPLKCSISVNDLELHKNTNYYAVKDISEVSQEAGILSSFLWWWSVRDGCLQRQSVYN